MTNSAMSTLCVLYTSHFPHSRIQNTFQSMFSTFHTPRFPKFTLHYTALSLPLLPSLSRAVSSPNSLLLLPRVQSRAKIPYPFPVERLPRRLHRTPRFPHPELQLFQTTIYTVSKIDFLEAICWLSYNRLRCLATLEFFPKDSKTAI